MHGEQHEVPTPIQRGDTVVRTNDINLTNPPIGKVLAISKTEPCRALVWFKPARQSLWMNLDALELCADTGHFIHTDADWLTAMDTAFQEAIATARATLERTVKNGGTEKGAAQLSQNALDANERAYWSARRELAYLPTVEGAH